MRQASGRERKAGVQLRPATMRKAGLLAALFAAAISLLLLLAQGPAPSRAQDAPLIAEAQPAAWRFRDASRKVKVVVLAGSIGAFRREPYAERLGKMCSQVEVKNLSQTGLGAWALHLRFRDQVLRNRALKAAEGSEFWLVLAGGLNSVANPEKTNRHLRDLMVHRVVGFSLTPWGDERDPRWKGAQGLRYWGATRKVSDFMLGRLEPQAALGVYAAKREGGNKWQAGELPDISVDLFDSPLRDRQAAPRDLAKSRSDLERDANWKQLHRDLSPEARAQKLDKDAQLLASLPQWFLRKELRSFDHVHPNTEGHRILTETACPALPPSWGCRCPQSKGER